MLVEPCIVIVISGIGLIKVEERKKISNVSSEKKNLILCANDESFMTDTALKPWV